ncbi:hypothetical protein ACP3P6_16960 [Enterobacter mori]
MKRSRAGWQFRRQRHSAGRVGIEATVDGKTVLIVAAGKSSHPEVKALEQTGQTVVTLMQDGVAKGCWRCATPCAMTPKRP